MPKVCHSWINEDVPGCGWTEEFVIECPNCEQPFCSTDSQQVFGSLYLLYKKNKVTIGTLQDEVTALTLQLTQLKEDFDALHERVYSCKAYKPD